MPQHNAPDFESIYGLELTPQLVAGYLPIELQTTLAAIHDEDPMVGEHIFDRMMKFSQCHLEELGVIKRQYVLGEAWNSTQYLWTGFGHMVAEACALAELK
jgi:hypothetical protein